MCVLLLICKILTDILHGNERVDLDAELLADLHNGGLVRVLADLTAVYRNEHIGNLHICAALEHRHGLTDSGACGDYVLDDDNAVTVLRLVADDIAALAVVLGLLAVEEERLVDAVIAGQRTGNRGSKRDALVRRTEHCVELIADGLLDQSCVKLTQTGVLQAGLVVAGVDEIRGLSTGFGCKIAEAQYVGTHHKFDKFLFSSSKHDRFTFFYQYTYPQYTRIFGREQPFLSGRICKITQIHS